MTTGKTIGGVAYLETIEEMNIELNKVIEDFMRAVDVEALRSAKRSGKRVLSQLDDSSFSVVPSREKRARASRARPFASAP